MKSYKYAFSLMEMMVVMLIMTIVLAASTPLITRRASKKPEVVYKVVTIQVPTVTQSAESQVTALPQSNSSNDNTVSYGQRKALPNNYENQYNRNIQSVTASDNVQQTSNAVVNTAQNINNIKNENKSNDTRVQQLIPEQNNTINKNAAQNLSKSYSSKNVSTNQSSTLNQSDSAKKQKNTSKEDILNQDVAAIKTVTDDSGNLKTVVTLSSGKKVVVSTDEKGQPLIKEYSK